MQKISVLHFTKVINRNDFIDVVIRNADSEKFLMMASSYNGDSNIEDPKFKEHGIPFFTLDIEHGWLDLFKGAFRLNKILRKQRIQILHTHHYYEAIIGRLACWLYPSCKHIVGRHYHDQFYLTTSGFKLKYYLFAEHVVNSFAAAIVVPSNAIVDLLIKQKVERSKIRMIPYCFDFKASRYQKLSETEICKIKEEMAWTDKFVVGNIARHHLIKGQTYLLKAFRKIKEEIPNSILVMIGDGPLHSDLCKEAVELGISENVQFLGWRKDGHRLINAMDVVIHPTLQEAFPQIMIEVMALGKPLVITKVSGATDVVEDRKNGFLIPSRATKEIAQTVKELYGDSDLVKDVSSRAFEYVRSHFTIGEIIPEFEKVYESVIKNP